MVGDVWHRIGQPRPLPDAPGDYLVKAAGHLAGIRWANSWNVLWENALDAIDAVQDHLVTPAVDKVIEANTLLSGLGFESGGLAAAQAIHNGLTAVEVTHGLAHGQKVNIGSVTQLVMEGAPSSDIGDFIEFTTRVGLPRTLTEVGLEVDDVRRSCCRRRWPGPPRRRFA